MNSYLKKDYTCNEDLMLGYTIDSFFTDFYFVYNT